MPVMGNNKALLCIKLLLVGSLLSPLPIAQAKCCKLQRSFTIYVYNFFFEGLNVDGIPPPTVLTYSCPMTFPYGRGIVSCAGAEALIDGLKPTFNTTDKPCFKKTNPKPKPDEFGNSEELLVYGNFGGMDEWVDIALTGVCCSSNVPGHGPGENPDCIPDANSDSPNFY